MMDYLIRFSQSHETFRLPEIQALAVIEGVDLKVVSYSLDACIFPSLPILLLLFFSLPYPAPHSLRIFPTPLTPSTYPSP